MLRRARVLCLVSAVGLAASAAPSSANSIVNGSFETGTLASWTQFGNTGFAGVQGNFGGVNPTDGAFQAFFGPVGSTGGIAQTIATTIGQSYVFSFDLHNFGGTPSSVAASFGGTTVLSLANPGAFNYTSFLFPVVATGASTAVTFTFRQDPSFFLLDNVSVEAVGAAVPEPASMLLLGSGLAGIAARFRRNRRKTNA
jgi:hypothetical protein